MIVIGSWSPLAPPFRTACFLASPAFGCVPTAASIDPSAAMADAWPLSPNGTSRRRRSCPRLQGPRFSPGSVRVRCQASTPRPPRACAPLPNAEAVVAFPVAAGSLDVPDPHRPTGYLALLGAVRLHRGDRRILLRELVFDANRSQLRASIGDHAVVIATTEGLRGTREGADIAIASDLRLGPKAARLFSTGLKPAKAFVAGQRLGFLNALAVAGSEEP